ncbi:MAG: GNAT family N-acetyltransferase [Clostridiaceae bacterium]|nr:GNAT family N-acetyltransferase [Eubacteriales bacterium]
MASLKETFSFTPLQYMLASVGEKPLPAKLWQGNGANAMLLGHYIFIAGTPDKAAFGAMERELLPQSVRAELGCAIVFYESEGAARLFKDRFEKTYGNERSVYAYTGSRPIPAFEAPEGYEIVPVTREFLHSETENLAMLTEEVLGTATYADMEDFCANGIGFCALYKDALCGFCTSEYPSPPAVAVGIAVEEAHQRKGLARAMAARFLREAAKRGYAVYWECWKRNEPSYRTALSCGFKKKADYPVLFIEFDGR